MTTRRRLHKILRSVVEERFIYYRYQTFPLSLQLEEYAVDIHRASPPAPATGTIAEMADILERYLRAGNFVVAEVVAGNRDRLSFTVTPAI